MAVRIGRSVSIDKEELLEMVSEAEILSYYLGIRNIPCMINSPLRKDNHPSFGFYTPDRKRIFWNDFSTKEGGGTFDLLGKLWNKDFNEVLSTIFEDLHNIKGTSSHTMITKGTIKTLKECDISVDLRCKVRDWRPHDIEYWESYGIPKKWAILGDIYPISHKIVIKDDKKMIFPADKYAYAYAEFKDGKTTLKIYQPFNKHGYKWSNKHDRSVISLWTKIPEYGERVCICASLKDALCLWANVGIPSIAPQGEGYGMSSTAIKELKRRYKEIYILLDNDEAGLLDGEKLSQLTGFTNLVLPSFDGGKDISDLYKRLNNKDQFKKIILDLFEKHNC